MEKETSEALCHLNNFPILNDMLKSKNIPNITSFSGSHNSFAIISTSNPPIYFNTKTNVCFQFPASVPIFQDCLCVAISEDENYIAIGHVDGSISIWSVEKRTLIKQHIKMHKSPISSLSFGHNSETLYAGDVDGLVTYIYITNTAGLITTIEVEIYNCNSPITGLVFSNSKSPICIGFILTDSKFITINPLAFGSIAKIFVIGKVDDSAIIGESNQFRNPPHIYIAVRNFRTYVTVTSDVNQYFYEACDRCILRSIGSYTETEENLDFTPFLSHALYVLISRRGLLKVTTRTGDEVLKVTDSNILSAISQAKDVLTCDEKLYILTTDTIHEITFPDYHSSLQSLIHNGKWSEAFTECNRTYSGETLTLLGLPDNINITRTLIQREMCILLTMYSEYIISNSLPNESLETGFKNAIQSAVKMELGSFVAKDLLELFKEKSQLNFFFSSIFSSDFEDRSSFSSFSFVSEYISYSASANLLSSAESTLLTLSYNPAEAKDILIDAHSNHMLLLCSHLLENYLHDYVLDCQLHYEAHDLLPFLHRAFLSSEPFSISSRRALVLWLFFPTSGRFDRLHELYESDWSQSGLFTAEFLKLCPIHYTLKKSLSIAGIVDAIMRTIQNDSFSQVHDILECICPLYLTEELEYSSHSIPHIINWVFLTGTSDSDSILQRQSILQAVLSRYPGIIPSDRLISLSLNSGFIDIVQELLIPEKKYVLLLSAALSSPTYRESAFDIIDSNIDQDPHEVLEAVVKHFPTLILVSPTKAASTVSSSSTLLEAKADLLHGCTRLQQYLFLNAWHEIIGDLSKEDLMKLFDLTCEFNPAQAKELFTAEKDLINYNEAQKICERREIFDCSIEILKEVGDYNGAIAQMGTALNQALLRLIDSPEAADLSIATLNDVVQSELPELQNAHRMVKLAVELLKSIDRGGSGTVFEWQKMFVKFQFPLYHMQAKLREGKITENVKKTVIVLFSDFVIQALDAIPAEVVFPILAIYFGCLEKDQFRVLFQTIFALVEYQLNVAENVEEMLVEDCLKVVEQSYIKKTKGIQAHPSVRCQSCQQQLSKGTDPFIVFPCGHCFHDREECGSYKACPICNGGINRQAQNQQMDNTNKMSTRKIQQLMRRMEFSLRKNWGDEKATQNNSVAPFFAKKEENDYDDQPKEDVEFLMLGIPEKIIEVSLNKGNDDEEDDFDY